MIRQTFGHRLDDSCRRNQSFAQPKRRWIDQPCQQAYRNQQERHDSTAEDSICDARSLLPELLVRRRAILTANGLRSSCCCCWKPRKRTPQSHAWHNVAGLCLMHFPRFRKTQTSRCDVQLHPQFTSWDNRGAPSLILWRTQKIRFDAVKNTNLEHLIIRCVTRSKTLHWGKAQENVAIYSCWTHPTEISKSTQAMRAASATPKITASFVS